MNLITDPSAIVHSIQLSVAPVFLLTAVAGMINAVATRLARIVDRARMLESACYGAQDRVAQTRAVQELQLLRRRGWLVTLSIGFLTLCGLLIGTTVLFLFLGETTGFSGQSWALGSFMIGLLAFLIALLLFFVETAMATQTLDFGHSLEQP